MKNKKGIVSCGGIEFSPMQLILYSVFLLILGCIIGIILKWKLLQCSMQ